MSKALKPPLFVLAVFVGVLAMTGISRLRSGKDLINWRASLADAQAEARKARKPTLIYFTAEWCGPCQSLKRTTWSNQKVAQAMTAYVPVKVDVDDDPGIAQKFGVQQIPMFLVLDENGEALASRTGAMGAAEMAYWLKHRSSLTPLPLLLR